MASTLSIAYITLNEEQRLPMSLEAVKEVADEIVIVDSGSTDATISIARAHGCKIIERQWTGYGDQKNAALQACTSDLILSLDADEVPTPELIISLQNLKSSSNAGTVYSLKMMTVFLGKKLLHTWQPDIHTRLVAKSIKPRWSEDKVHEKLIFDSGSHEPELLNGFVLHYTYTSISHQMEKMMAYARLGADDLFIRGKKSSVGKIFARPLWRFFRQYVLRAGFRDGIPGLLAIAGESYYVYLKYALLAEKQLKDQK